MDRFDECIAHVDMDAFFVEVERLRDPALRGVPVIVGGLGARGVVAAASYEARRYGVGSAMPMIEARRRCPQATYLPPIHSAYGEVSGRVFAVLEEFTPLVEGLSVDEAFLDISGLRLHFPDPESVGAAIRERIRTEVGIPASVGIATSKFIAKLASEAAKPDGMLRIRAGTELDFLHPLPVRRLWGVGEATHAALEGLGVLSVGDLAALSESALASRLGPSLAAHLAALARAEDDRKVEPGGGAKSVSVEATFESDLRGEEVIDRELLRLCDRLSIRLRRPGLAGRTLTLKVRYEDFTTVTRSVTVREPIEHTADLWDEARTLLGRVSITGRGVRLLGVGVSTLAASAAPRQLSMSDPRREAVAAAADEVRERFGDEAVVLARLVERRIGRDRPQP